MDLTNPNICFSGGAEGADLQFGMCSGETGHTVIHFTFKGHKSRAPSQEIVQLTDEQLDVADEYCKRASETLKRYYPPKSQFVRNLLRRNYYQIMESERVYAVSQIENGQVKGGTAWATQMFIDKHDGAVCEAYVYDQVRKQWFMWSGSWWEAITAPPKPHGMWTGIGTRELNVDGKTAIRELLGWQKTPE